MGKKLWKITGVLFGMAIAMRLVVALTPVFLIGGIVLIVKIAKDEL